MKVCWPLRKIVGNTVMILSSHLQLKFHFKGTVQRKLTGVLSGINQQLMISQSVAWNFYLNLKGLGPLNLNKLFSAA
jgi:hypothetical protein